LELTGPAAAQEIIRELIPEAACLQSDFLRKPASQD
jgi:hypothetical protein